MYTHGKSYCGVAYQLLWGGLTDLFVSNDSLAKARQVLANVLGGQGGIFDANSLKNIFIVASSRYWSTRGTIAPETKQKCHTIYQLPHNRHSDKRFLSITFHHSMLY